MGGLAVRKKLKLTVEYSKYTALTHCSPGSPPDSSTPVLSPLCWEAQSKGVLGRAWEGGTLSVVCPALGHPGHPYAEAGFSDQLESSTA